jgi:hypothetical protein
MKQFRYIHFLFISVTLLVLGSCIKEKQFPPQPLIKFDRFNTFGNDSADCYITFQDGDGDIGIPESDITSPDDLRMKYLYKDQTGTFVPVDSSFGTPQFDTLFYSYRVPNITPDGQYKALDGEIKIKLRAAPIFGPHDVVKFEITLTDRAGNKSNVVSTNEITVP